MHWNLILLPIHLAETAVKLAWSTPLGVKDADPMFHQVLPLLLIGGTSDQIALELLLRRVGFLLEARRPQTPQVICICLRHHVQDVTEQMARPLM
jgi:hypothetical protein